MQSNLRAQAEIQAQRKKVRRRGAECVCAPAMRHAPLRTPAPTFSQKSDGTFGRDETGAKTKV
jgi:hypothetical protein